MNVFLGFVVLFGCVSFGILAVRFFPVTVTAVACVVLLWFCLFGGHFINPNCDGAELWLSLVSGLVSVVGVAIALAIDTDRNSDGSYKL